MSSKQLFRKFKACNLPGGKSLKSPMETCVSWEEGEFVQWTSSNSFLKDTEISRIRIPSLFCTNSILQRYNLTFKDGERVALSRLDPPGFSVLHHSWTRVGEGWLHSFGRLTPSKHSHQQLRVHRPGVGS